MMRIRSTVRFKPLRNIVFGGGDISIEYPKDILKAVEEAKKKKKRKSRRASRKRGKKR